MESFPNWNKKLLLLLLSLNEVRVREYFDIGKKKQKEEPQ